MIAGPARRQDQARKVRVGELRRRRFYEGPSCATARACGSTAAASNASIAAAILAGPDRDSDSSVSERPWVASDQPCRWMVASRRP